MVHFYLAKLNRVQCTLHKRKYLSTYTNLDSYLKHTRLTHTGAA